MKLLKKLIPLLLLLGPQFLSAQTRVVTGRVLDADEQPLAGVAVIIENTAKGTMTLGDGGFSLDVPAGDVVLEVSCLGYITEKVTVRDAQAFVTIYMQEDAIMLDEMVVIGYGTQKKVNLTGAVSVVDGSSLENRAAQNLSNMLQGSVAGLNVTTSSGVPGSSATINVRGTTSINGGDPLVLIDGAVGELDTVNSNDVESISVIKDASAAAVYGARAAFGVILVTTKSGSNKEGKATVRYSGRFGWVSPTTSTDYETTGYWSVYTVNKFWNAYNGSNYVNYTDEDMRQLLARVNDKTENPNRPWTVTEVRNGKNQWVYYGNYDWWHMLYQDNRPTQQHSISINGGSKGVKYFVSGGYERQEGLLKTNTDIYRKYNLRAKIDFDISKWITFSNNTSFYSSNYTYQGDGSVENTLAYSARHALACFPMQNPDGSWLYGTPYLNYKVANGRHIIINEGTHRNEEKTFVFANTSRLDLKFFPTFKLTADFTYRLREKKTTSRSQPWYYREYPDGDLLSYSTGAGLNELTESDNSRQYYTANVYFTYDETYKDKHHLTVTGGGNYEYMYYKYISAYGQDLISTTLDDFGLVGQNDDGETVTGVDGSQANYALLGFFGRINYDYSGRYLFEVSGRYDGSSRFAKGHRWGFFPSASLGYRISEEPFFEPARSVVDNMKIRASFGSLGNQDVSSYYTYLRTISTSEFSAYSFGESSSMAKYSTLSAPVAGDLSWEISQQWDLGLDVTMFGGRLDFTGDVYIRDTKDMLAEGIALPSVYGADSPEMNVADLRTKGYELSLSWRDQFTLFGKPFEYSISGNVSDYKSVITKYDNPNKSLAYDYYEGMEIGEIWGFKTDGLFQSTEEAQAYASEVDLSYINNVGGWQGGDLKYLDINGDGIIGIGQNTVDDSGDRTILGNSLPSFQYGFKFGFNYFGFDVSVFFQGTGNHYWYPTGQAMSFWGCYSYPYLTYLPKNFLNNVWSTDNTDAYFPRAVAYASTSGSLKYINDRYLQNLRYLRLKNLTVGYTVPQKLTRKIGVEKIRVYYTGENLSYWSPIKKNSVYVDPEAAFDRSDAYNNAYYPWPKTSTFGIDITF